MEKFDVIIAGAGIAGLSAAYTSVKNGLHTALVEKENNSGGIAKDCFHTYICGLFKNDDTKSFQIANKGICSDVFTFLHKCYGDKSLVKIGKVETLAFKQQDLWDFFNNNLNKNKEKFSFFKNAECIEVLSMNKKIQKLRISAQKKEFNLGAGVFIDATGCAYLSNKDDKPDDSSNDTQLGGFCMLLEGESDKDLSLLVPYNARKIVQKYELDDYLKYVTITYNFLTNQNVLKFSVQEHEDIEKCNFIFQKLNKEIEQLSALKHLKSSKKMNPRSCSHLTNNNAFLKNQNKQNDLPCVKSYWPVERWDKNRGPNYEYIKKDKPFLIYNSALKDKNFDNLFLAGKSIQVSEQTHASARVMGVCMATGEHAVLNAYNYLQEN